MLNLRVFRIAPSRNGHVGYTKRGFYLNKEEAAALRDALVELLEDEDLFTIPDETLKEVSDTLKGRDE